MASGNAYGNVDDVWKLPVRESIIWSPNEESWFNAMAPEFTKPYFIELGKFLKREREPGKPAICPREEDVFAWTRYCAPEQVKVVIVGQDPYPDPDLANGLCFSINGEVPSDSSLAVVFQELSETIPGFSISDRRHGDLTGWAEQGVLLLNAALTVREGEPNSHKKAFGRKQRTIGRGWKDFTDAVIKYISDGKRDGVVFILCGGVAKQKKRKKRIDKVRHRILECDHPSGRAAIQGTHPLYGSGCFSEANRLLGLDRIDWCKLPRMRF